MFTMLVDLLVLSSFRLFKLLLAALLDIHLQYKPAKRTFFLIFSVCSGIVTIETQLFVRIQLWSGSFSLNQSDFNFV